MIWVEYALTGLFAGFLAGYLGIGGGLVLVPALSWLFSRDPATANVAVQMAVATSLATMLFTSMSSLLAHHRRGAILWSLVKQMIPARKHYCRPYWKRCTGQCIRCVCTYRRFANATWNPANRKRFSARPVSCHRDRVWYRHDLQSAWHRWRQHDRALAAVAWPTGTECRGHCLGLRLSDCHRGYIGVCNAG